MDAFHILAVQKLSTLFPKVHIVADIHYRFNIRFMYYAEKNALHTNTKTLVKAWYVDVVVVVAAVAAAAAVLVACLYVYVYI